MSTVASETIAHLTGVAPQFLVDDLDRAIAYYRDKLGFELDFEYQSFYAAVSRDGFAIHLKCAPKPAGEREHRKRNEHLDAYFAVSGIRHLVSELKMRGAHVLKPLEERPWDASISRLKILTATSSCFSEQNANLNEEG